jgi:hypothetical protein
MFIKVYKRRAVEESINVNLLNVVNKLCGAK